MARRRQNGEGTIRKRSDGRWEGRVIVGHMEDGTPISEYVYARTQKELLLSLHNVMEDQRGIDLNENSLKTLGEWLDQWVEEHGKLNLRPNTYVGYKRMIRKVKEYLGDKQIKKVTTADIQHMYNQLKAKGRDQPDKNGTYELSAASVRSIHMMLHEALDAAVGARLIAKNPTKGTSIPKLDRKEMKVLNDEQLDKFLDEIEKEPVWYDFFYTAITTGLRRGEICGLKWEDLDIRMGTLRIRRTVTVGPKKELVIGDPKTETGKRTIILPQSTLELLIRRRASAITEWIFPSILYPEKPVAPSSAYNRLKEILRSSGLPDIRFHDLRHTFATHALKNGIDAKTLSGLLGHTNASFTLDTYTHITDDMKQHASNVVEDFMTELFGEDLKPWETKEEKRETEH